jgi:hypothetical protein
VSLFTSLSAREALRKEILSARGTEGVMGLFIGVCYDLKEGYLKAGFSASEVMEFDDEETIIGLEDALC